MPHQADLAGGIASLGVTGVTAHEEIETKFALTDPAAVRAALLSLGAAFQGRNYEDDLRFDDANRTLTAHGIVLRLRRVEGADDTRHILTHKTPGYRTEENVSIRVERETEVTDDCLRSSLLLDCTRSIASAKPAIVGFLNIVRTGKVTCKISCIRTRTWVMSNECPPTAKKLW